MVILSNCQIVILVFYGGMVHNKKKINISGNNTKAINKKKEVNTIDRRLPPCFILDCLNDYRLSE